MLNLLYSLPDVLQGLIYEFDSTFTSTFKSVDFKNELTFYQLSHFDRKKLNQCVLEQFVYYLDDLNYDNLTWSNEFGFFNFNFTKESVNYYSSQSNLIDFIQNNYQITYFPDDNANDIVKFKILPQNLEIPDNILYYDGFICSNQTSILIEDGLIEHPVPNTYPIFHPSSNITDIAVWISSRY